MSTEIIKPDPTSLPHWEAPTPPTDLIFDDGEPLESNRHRIGMNVLIRSLNQFYRQRDDFFAGGNMFIYYSREQAKNRDFRGPDFFVVLNVDGTYPRQGWVVWEEAGRYPDVIVELMSPSTAEIDVTVKKTLYEQTFRTPDYFVYNPFDEQSLQGWHLDSSQTYQPLVANEQGWLWSEKLGLWLGVWEGEIDRETAPWLRFYDPQGELVPLPEEAAETRAEAAETRAEAAETRAEAAERERNQTKLAQIRAISQLLAQGMTSEQVATILSLPLDVVEQHSS